MLPITELAVNRRNSAAGVPTTLLDLGNWTGAAFASKHRVLQNIPLSDTLAAIARRTAIAP
jgi:hypothetical protein